MLSEEIVEVNPYQAASFTGLNDATKRNEKTAKLAEDLLLETPEDVAIIDVRDEDRVHGWIPNSIHFPTSTITADTLTNFVCKKEIQSKKLLIFHCMFSQVRGPQAANMCVATLASLGLAKAPRVGLLAGGYQAWKHFWMYDRPELIVKK